MARIHEHTVNIAAPLTLVSAIPLAMQGDAEADELRLHVVDGRESADMKGYTVGGYLERADGVRVMLKGSVTADMVEVKLQEACYRVPGAYKAFVRLTKTTGEKMTLFLFAGRIESEGDGEIVDEENTLPSVEELIAMIEEIDRAIAGANTARDGANAAATRADAAAAEALKAAENAGRAEKAANDAAYEANAAADAADEAAVGASAWAKATMESETLPEGSKPTISVEKNVNGGNVIRVGIPAGKTGNTGETGATPQITFEVETGAAGSDVKVEQSGTAETPHIKLTIPRGDTGAVDGVDYYEGDPAPLGTANPGTSNGLARGNHVHPMPNADDVGARPANWMPTAADVGARPANWMPTAAEVGALPNTYTAPVQSVNGQTGDVNVSELRVNGATSLSPFGDDRNGYGFPAGRSGDGTEFNISRSNGSGHVGVWEGGDFNASGAFYTELNKPTPSDIGAAPTSHASTATTYGIGTGSNYGHVKLSDSTSSSSAASAGIAASPKAVKAAYDLANGKATRVFYTGTLTTSGWSSSAPYTQSITVSGILATDTPVVDLNMSSATASTAANLQNAWSYVGRIVTAANKITAYCYTNKPTVALPINILVLR